MVVLACKLQLLEPLEKKCGCHAADGGDGISTVIFAMERPPAWLMASALQACHAICKVHHYFLTRRLKQRGCGMLPIKDRDLIRD